ncbi:putative Cell cycle and apoptosis regulator protein [Helianthus annuus]|nr:putative Cell cycle and apoptosis regulator protein [Helianthus annuus]
MYPSRGNTNYGQQQQQQQQTYSGQSAYGQNVGSDGGASQLSMSSRHAAMLAGHPSAGAHYGGQYSSVYGSAGLSTALQTPGASAKGSGPSGLESRIAYGSTRQESPGDRRPYSVHDSQNEPTARFAGSVAYGHHQHQGDIYDRLDAASALRKELMQAQTLQSSSVEGSSRRRSPVKAKRRDYVCKVYSSNLVDVERGYLSIDKRYPRLFTSPECSKVIVNWPRDDVKVSLNVPVSFEHDFVQVDEEPHDKEASVVTMMDNPLKSEHGSIRWNAKVILMSGLSPNALEELSSERDYEDRIPHFCNMLRFACLKNGNSLIAIGGLWEPSDGNDPSVEKSTLVQTAIRHAKDITGLDLKSCQHWNPFLEIHYDRVGKDGLFSHKEVTVLYLPDLSDCLPSVDAWRDQWLANKKAIAERERLHALKREISREKKEGLKDTESEKSKDVKKDSTPVKKKASGSSGSASKATAKSKGKVKESGKEGVESNAEMETKVEGNDSENKKPVEEAAAVQKTGSGKKKIKRKVVKKKVVGKDDKPENAAKKSDASDPKTAEETTTASTNSEAAGQEEKSTESPAVKKTFTRKKVTKKVPVKKTVKKTVKRKIIKKVVKRKVVAKNANNKDNIVEEAGITSIEQSAPLVNPESEVKLEVNESASSKDAGNLDNNDNKKENDQVMDENKAKVDSGSLSKAKVNNGNNENLKDVEKSKEGKVKKEKGDQTESKGKEVKDKKMDEEIPRHPGLFLQTKGSKDSKLRSLSLSLDSLLGYDDNDIEESTFELSLFAEAFYEMLQYQMGSRILAFLQKLRIKYVAKRNQKKRQLEEASEKEKEKTLAKRAKTNDSKVESKSVSTETQEEQKEDGKIIADVETETVVTEKVENVKSEGNEDMDEDPEEDPEEDSEEDPEEDEDMIDGTENPKTEQEVNAKEETVNSSVKLEDAEEQENEIGKGKLETKKKENIDKELLQACPLQFIFCNIFVAFRFFDRNRVGHVRVEDMRLIIHNLGKFLSHRDVKDLVQSALLESNTGRDDRILYNKLVRMDI